MPRARSVDRTLLAATVLTAILGVVMVASASGTVAHEHYGLPEFEFGLRQAVAVVLGLGALLAATFVPIDRLLSVKVALPLLGGTWLALLIPFFQGRVAGTHRWLQLPLGSLQPSALAKVTLPLALAAWIAHCRGRRYTPARTFYPALAMLGVTAGLVLVEPDLGSALLLAAAALAILWLAEIEWKPLVILLGAGAVVVVVAILAKPYRMERVRTFFGETSWQVQQSLIALGGGGLFGRGPGQSLQKLFFLPQPHTDFIFAVLGEELGLLGGLVVLSLLGTIVVRGLLAANRAHSMAAALLAAGAAVTVAVQTLLNVSVCLKLLPAKGLPLPLISSGGSDVLLTMTLIGLLLNVAKEGGFGPASVVGVRR
jgi:cell division protein FtsW